MRSTFVFGFLVIAAASASPLSAHAAAPAAHPVWERQVEPFFRTYCLRCHDAKKQEGMFRLDTLTHDFTDQSVAERWGEVVFRINNGEMPPKDEPQPKPDELGAAVETISTRLREGEAARMARRGPVAHYRLSRDEYAHTVYDLLGVHYDVTLPGTFNEDPRWHGFERVGSMLSLSPSHFDRYLQAAEVVLDRAFPDRPVASKLTRQEANAGREEWLKQHGLTGPVRWQLWPGKKGQGFNIKDPGLYRIRIQLSGLQPAEGRVPHLSIWNPQTKRSIYDEDVLAPEDKPIVLEIEMPLSPGGYSLANEMPGFNETGNHTLNVLNGGGSVFTNSREVGYLNPTGYKLFDDDGRAIFPMLLVDWIEWEGPLTTDDDLRKRDGIIPASLATKQVDPTEVRAGLRRFASRAWRRPVADAEIQRYVKVMESETAAGEKPGTAYRAALTGILASKNFFYLEEGSAQTPRDRVNDVELASRLSYFLWGSMPDDGLFEAAGRGELHRPEVLKSQWARMLADPKSARFSDAFPRQWLQLHRVGTFPPDPGLYPDYDKWLEQSMILESTRFFRTVFDENLSLREFLTSDWTMVNARLALHYGILAPAGSGLQKVKLKPEDHRGGLLTQAGILSLSSDGTRHRPVHRGVWVSEAIFGRTPPPPPPNVEPLEPTPSDKPKATIRQQLEAHGTHAVCASCHRKIDPLGFAFDSFDAIGRRRTEEQAIGGKGANPPVDASGVLVDGRKFAGTEEFKKLLADDTDRFAEAFVEQLATFALRRVMTIDDAPQIRAIAAASRADGYRLRTVIENFVTSDLFQKR
jgi:hypothetical protein